MVTDEVSETGQPVSAGDYFEIITPDDVFYVSREMVMCIERAMNRWWQPRWATFVDVAGARVRVRARTIVIIRQSDAEQRAAYREMRRAWREESNADCDWDD